MLMKKLCAISKILLLVIVTVCGLTACSDNKSAPPSGSLSGDNIGAATEQEPDTHKEEHKHDR